MYKFVNPFRLIIALSYLISSSLLASEIQFDCDYKKYSDKNGLQKSKGFELTFILDTKSNKAYMLGNLGSVGVTFLKRPDNGLNFFEITQSGNAMLTTILSNGSSVHSRHTAILNEFVTSQYYGACTIK